MNARRAWKVEGIFRLSAPTYAVRALWAFIGSDDFTLVRVENIHVISAALKMYLRELKSHVLKRELYTQIIGCMRSSSKEEQKAGMKYIVSLLDPVRRVVLYDLCAVCVKILDNSAVNKMDRDNLAICVSPSIIEPDVADPIAISQTSSLSRNAFSLLLTDLDFFFDPVQLKRDRESLGSPQEQPPRYAWERLSEQEWERLLASAQCKSFVKGEIILEERGVPTALYRVQSGSCVVSYLGFELHELMELDVFGSACSFDMGWNCEGTVECTAQTETKLYILPESALCNALLIDVDFALKWYCTQCWEMARRATRLLYMAGNATVMQAPPGRRVLLPSPGIKELVQRTSATATTTTTTPATPTPTLLLSPEAKLAASPVGPAGSGAGGVVGGVSGAARPKHTISAGGGGGVGLGVGVAVAANKHSSTLSYSLKSYSAKLLDRKDAKKKTFQQGTLALTPSMIFFEREGGAMFVPLEGIVSVSPLPDKGHCVFEVTHRKVDAQWFQLDDESELLELFGIMQAIICGFQRREQREASEVGVSSLSSSPSLSPPPSGPPPPPASSSPKPQRRRVLCTQSHSGSENDFHLKVEEGDIIRVIKDDPTEEFWYGEHNGKHGYFLRSHVMTLPLPLTSALDLSPGDWVALEKCAERLQFEKGEVICAAGDVSSLGFLWIVKSGVCMQANNPKQPEMNSFLVANWAFGEVGVLLGTTPTATVSAFSKRVLIWRLDCRMGSAASTLLHANVHLAASLWRFVAACCAARVDLLMKKVEEARVQKLLQRERIMDAVRNNELSSGGKMEFEEAIVVMGSSSPPASGKTTKKKKSRVKVAKKSSRLALKPQQQQQQQDDDGEEEEEGEGEEHQQQQQQERFDASAPHDSSSLSQETL